MQADVPEAASIKYPLEIIQGEEPNGSFEVSPHTYLAIQIACIGGLDLQS